MAKIHRAALTALAVLCLVGPSSAALAPDFSWSKSCPPRNRRLLADAETAWHAALSLERYPGAAKQVERRSIEDYLGCLLSRADFADLTAALLDAAMHSEKHLDECRSLYTQATSCLKPNERRIALRRFEKAYHCARARTRLATAIARAGLARKMAASENTSYCLQAMESAIDALRDSASAAERCAECKEWVPKALGLRASMLEAWERAQRAKDPGLIAGYNLRDAYEQSFARASNSPALKQP